MWPKFIAIVKQCYKQLLQMCLIFDERVCAHRAAEPTGWKEKVNEWFSVSLSTTCFMFSRTNISSGSPGQDNMVGRSVISARSSLFPRDWIQRNLNGFYLPLSHLLCDKLLDHERDGGSHSSESRHLALGQEVLFGRLTSRARVCFKDLN